MIEAQGAIPRIAAKASTIGEKPLAIATSGDHHDDDVEHDREHDGRSQRPPAGGGHRLSRTGPRPPRRRPRCGGRRRPRSSPATSAPCCGTASSARRGSSPTGAGAARAPRRQWANCSAPSRGGVGHEVVLGAGAEAGRRATGRPCSRMTALTPASQRSASGIIRSNASSVRTSPSVARMAAIDRALPGQRPADAADVRVLLGHRSAEIRSASASVIAVGRRPGCRRRSSCRSRACRARGRARPVMPPGPAQIVWVSSMIRSVPCPAGELADAPRGSRAPGARSRRSSAPAR